MVKPVITSPSPPSIQERIKLAQVLYVTWAQELLTTPSIQRLLEQAKQHITTTRNIIFSLGIFDICKHCDEEEGGSCCGAGIEEKYNVVLLLINLILGVSLPEKRYKENSCYFLNEHGCILMARHVLCVNYLCSIINQSLTPDELIRLQNIAGNELDTLFMLNEAIKKTISRKKHVQ